MPKNYQNKIIAIAVVVILILPVLYGLIRQYFFR